MGHRNFEIPEVFVTAADRSIHAIAQSGKWDTATFEIPEAFGNAADRSIKTQHRPLIWPPTRAQMSDVVIYGGFPGVLREEKGSTAEIKFQWVGARVNEVTDQNIVLEPQFATMQWQSDESNDNPGGWSGGPVFRSNESGPIARLELIGFIYEFPFEQVVLARHADVVLADGTLR